jgi:hypothetical protein
LVCRRDFYLPVLFLLVRRRPHIYSERKGEAKKYEAFLLNFQKTKKRHFLWLRNWNISFFLRKWIDQTLPTDSKSAGKIRIRCCNTAAHNIDSEIHIYESVFLGP